MATVCRSAKFRASQVACFRVDLRKRGNDREFVCEKCVRNNCDNNGSILTVKRKREVRLRQAIVGDNSSASCVKVPVRRSLTKKRHECELDCLFGYAVGDDEDGWHGIVVRGLEVVLLVTWPVQKETAGSHRCAGRAAVYHQPSTMNHPEIHAL